MTRQKRHESRVAKIAAFHESAAALLVNNIFGLPFSVEESEVVLIPVPWEVTVSFRPGTAKGPEAIREASRQVDLYDPATPDAWKYGFAMEQVIKWVETQAPILRGWAVKCILHQNEGGHLTPPQFLDLQAHVNEAGSYLNSRIERKALSHLKQDKIVGVVGGDHSVPLGLMQALAAHYGSYGILHIDAHYDHRDAYEGFEFSHASIMRNASRISAIETFVHVGIRDYCKEEAEFVAASPRRFATFGDRDMAFNKFTGNSLAWIETCQRIIASLPERVYISFDIDGLDPKLCPDTGTPVPGGLEFQEVCFLLEQLLQSRRKIIGFDLCEVAPGSNNWASDWDANVGARILYRLCSLTATSVFGVYPR